MTATPAPTFTLHLHGAPQAIDAQGRVWPLEGRNAAVLAYVAFETGCSRERLAALLWPESDDPRRNLRQQLLRLKQAVGGALLVDGDASLRLAQGVSLAPAEDDAPLLGDLRWPANPEFDAWADALRTQQRERTSAVLLASVASAEAAGQYDEALALAQRLLALDPQAEAHHRALMRLHYLRGDRAAGLAVYERLVHTLRTQQGLDPDATTQALARTLRESGSGPSRLPALRAAATMPVTVLRPPRLIGRDDALAALRVAWAAHRAALVLGEPGLGKSRLLAEFCVSQRVAWAAGRPGDAGVPYATLARLLRRLRELHQPVQTSAQAQALASVVPEWASVGTPQRGDIRPALLSALEAWLVQARQRGLDALVLDDLHFADAASVEALQALIGSEALPGLRFALAARPGEIGAAGETLRNALVEARLLEEVALAPLDVAQMTALVESLALPGVDAARLGPQLARHCGGNPLYALETLKQGLTDGALAADAALPRPLGVGVLLERRLQKLSAPALALARVAAIAGVGFDIALAERVTGSSAVALADAWAELEGAQVLRDGTFAHDLVHDAVLRSVPMPIARRLHEQCAQHLAERGGEPARLGEHWAAAGRPGDAAHAFVEAAARALRAGRRVEQAAFLERAAHGFEATGDSARRFDTLVERAVALIQADFGTRADAALDELDALATDDAQRLRVAVARVDLVNMRGQLAETLAQGRPALALAQALRDRAAEVRIACPVAGALSLTGRPDAAYDLLWPLADYARDQAPPEVRQLWLAYWAIALDNLGRLREAVAAYEASIAYAQARGLPAGTVATEYSNLAVTYNKMGRSAEATSASERAARIVRDDPGALGQPLLTMLTLARHLAEDARYGEAITLFDELLPKVEASGARLWAVAGHSWYAALWIRLGQHARALRLLTTADEDLPAPLRATRLWLRAQVSMATGSTGGAALVEQASAMLPGETGSGLLMRALSARLAPAAETLAHAPRWIDAARRGERYGALLVALLMQAQAASALSDWGLTRAAADEALALLDEGITPEPIYRGEAWLILARALDAVGAAERALAARRAGMVWVQRHAVPHVPPEYLDSFLHRNPHNDALLTGQVVG